MTTTKTRSQAARLRTLPREFLAAPFQAQTYKNLLYLALAFPLGLAYFVGLVVGGSLGVGLLITWLGFPILLATLVGATAAAGVEAKLARQLVGTDARVPEFVRRVGFGDAVTLPGNGFLAAVKRLVTAPSTWTSVLLLFLKFGFGLVAFIALTVAGALTSAFIAAPVLYDQSTIEFTSVSISDYTLGPWVVDTLPEALALSVCGVVLLFVTMNLVNVLARFHAGYTAAALQVANPESDAR